MIKDLAFVIYAVTDMAQSREFYEKTLGLQVGETFGDGWVEFEVGSATFGITNNFPSSPQSSVAFEVDDLNAEVARLGAAGVKLEGGIGDFPGCRMQLLNDPDGHTICLHQRKK